MNSINKSGLALSFIGLFSIRLRQSTAEDQTASKTDELSF